MAEASRGSSYGKKVVGKPCTDEGMWKGNGVDGCPIVICKAGGKERIALRDDCGVLYWLYCKLFIIDKLFKIGSEGGRVIKDVVCKEVDGNCSRGSGEKGAFNGSSKGFDRGVGSGGGAVGKLGFG